MRSQHAAFDAYLGVSPSSGVPLKIGRGGIFGGTRAYLEAAVPVYDVMMAETLSRNLMGTEENLFRYYLLLATSCAQLCVHRLVCRRICDCSSACVCCVGSLPTEPFVVCVL